MADKDGYIYKINDKGKPIYIFKICILGQERVGKTCIAKRLCFDTFDVNTSAGNTIIFDDNDFTIDGANDGSISNGSTYSTDQFINLSLSGIGQRLQLYAQFASAAVDLENITLNGTPLSFWYDSHVLVSLVASVLEGVGATIVLLNGSVMTWVLNLSTSMVISSGALTMSITPVNGSYSCISSSFPQVMPFVFRSVLMQTGGA